MIGEAFVCILCVTLTYFTEVTGHGRLIDPPARSTMWRYGFNSPRNYDDNALYCGGFNRQWGMNGGRCGVCGDPFDGPRDHEAGGKYANGIITKTYTQGQTITVSVELTKSHMGWFEFRLCPNNNPHRAVTQQCLDSNLLRLSNGLTRYMVDSWDTKVHQISVQLPRGLTCSQCVLQWKYNAGNSWGCERGSSGCCIGCGHQEQFYGCADVAITGQGNNLNPVPVFVNNANNNNNNNNNNYGVLLGSLTNQQPINNNNNNNNYIPNNGGTPNGYSPINGEKHGSTTQTNSGIPAFDETRCRGVVEMYTAVCRINCSKGLWCPTHICSTDCLSLLPRI